MSFSWLVHLLMPVLAVGALLGAAEAWRQGRPVLALVPVLVAPASFGFVAGAVVVVLVVVFRVALPPFVSRLAMLSVGAASCGVGLVIWHRLRRARRR